jgi:hypothetical protein
MPLETIETSVAPKTIHHPKKMPPEFLAVAIFIFRFKKFELAGG